VTRWQAEMAGTAPGPTIATVLLIGLVLWLLANLAAATTPRAGASSPATVRPADTPVCVERARLERHGVTTGSHYRAVRVACRRVLGEGAAP
jgi:hypothetical protein